MTNPDVFSVPQVAEELRISRRAVIHRINAGTIKATKLGNGRTSSYVIARDELDRIKAAS